MTYRNEENDLQQRYELNRLAKAGLHFIVFLGAALASASLMSYVKQTQAPSSWCLVALSAVSCIFSAAASAFLYLQCRGSEDEEFNEPRRQCLLFALNGALGAALGLGLVMVCL